MVDAPKDAPAAELTLYEVATQQFKVDEQFPLAAFVASLKPHWEAGHVHLFNRPDGVYIYASKVERYATPPEVQHVWPPVLTKEST